MENTDIKRNGLFTVVDNSAVCDERLSLKALGLLVQLLSFTEKSEFSESYLFNAFKKDGQTSIRSGLKELENAGYLVRTQRRDEKGRITGTDWKISGIASWVAPGIGRR